MHLNKNSRGNSLQRVVRDARPKQPNVRVVLLYDRRTGLPSGSRVTMLDGIRVDRDGNPRSKTYDPRKADTPKHLRRQ